MSSSGLSCLVVAVGTVGSRAARRSWGVGLCSVCPRLEGLLRPHLPKSVGGTGVREVERFDSAGPVLVLRAPSWCGCGSDCCLDVSAARACFLLALHAAWLAMVAYDVPAREEGLPPLLGTGVLRPLVSVARWGKAGAATFAPSRTTALLLCRAAGGRAG